MNSVYAWSNGRGGVHFHRQAEPLRVLDKSESVTTGTGPVWSDELAERYNTLHVHMLWDEPNSQAWEKTARNGQHRMVFDIDDAMWATDAWEPFRKAYTPEVLERLYRNISMAHVVTTPSLFIAEHVARYNKNVHVVPNTVPAYLRHMRMRSRPNPVLGYQGSPSHLLDVTPNLSDAVGKFLTAHRDWRLHLWGADPKEEPVGGHVKHIPWQGDLREYYKSISMDIGLGLGVPSEFNRGKSDLRVREYAARGIPAIYSSDVPAYVETMTDIYASTGRAAGVLAADSEWSEALEWLADPDTMNALGRNAWSASEHFTTEANIGNWLGAWNSV